MGPLPNKDIGCHETGFEKTCFDMVTQKGCQKWVNVKGTHPQSGAQVDCWACADQWREVLKIEMARSMQMVAASLDKVATAIDKVNDSNMAEALGGINTQMRKFIALNEREMDRVLSDGPHPQLIERVE